LFQLVEENKKKIHTSHVHKCINKKKPSNENSFYTFINHVKIHAGNVLCPIIKSYYLVIINKKQTLSSNMLFTLDMRFEVIHWHDLRICWPSGSWYFIGSFSWVKQFKKTA
jgi:hypothetical protein